jgi:hypothetical protein
VYPEVGACGKRADFSVVGYFETYLKNPGLNPGQGVMESREGVGPTECHVSTGCRLPQQARWVLISLSPGLHELRQANDRALSPTLGWKVRQVARKEMIRLPSQSDTAHHLHFRKGARKPAARQSPSLLAVPNLSRGGSSC